MGVLLSNIRILLILTALFPLLMGCKNNNQDPYKGMSAAEIYARAEENVSKEKYGVAAQDFEALEARYPYGEYSDKAQLGLINAYYKQNEAALALTTADRFIRMHPRHPNVDYVYYQKGLVAFDQNYNFTFRYLPLDKSLRDPSTSQEAFDAFAELIQRFPNSQFVPDARQRMVFLRNQLANHELKIAEYYMQRKAYLSSANRASHIVKYYNGTPSIPRALVTMIVSYRALGMNQLAEDAYKILACNFPNSQEFKNCK